MDFESTHCGDWAEEACAKAQLNLTKKRRLILLHLLKTRKPLSPYEIAEQIAQEHQKSISPMSIYRMLIFFEQQKLVRKLRLVNKYIGCNQELSKDVKAVSQFLICSHCGSVSEIKIAFEAINKLRLKIAASGFQLKTPEMEIECLCNACHENSSH